MTAFPKFSLFFLNLLFTAGGGQQDPYTCHSILVIVSYVRFISKFADRVRPMRRLPPSDETFIKITKRTFPQSADRLKSRWYLRVCIDGV